MTMHAEAPLPPELLSRAHQWGTLKGWQRRELAADLRRLGLSYNEIGRLIPVGKGTLSVWCRDVELSVDAAARLRARRPAVAAQQAWGARRRSAALARHASLREAARLEARALLGDPFWVAGVVAYWAEGDKSSNRLRLANSDPNMIRLFVTWARTYLDVGQERIAVWLHLHSGQDDHERKRYWSDVIGVGVRQFGKSYVKPQGTGHRKKILYHGTASVVIRRSKDDLLRVFGWIDAVAERWSVNGSVGEDPLGYDARPWAASSTG